MPISRGRLRTRAGWSWLTVSAVVGILSPPGARAQAPSGAVEGRVTLEEAPAARRTASRYPGAQAGAHEIQPLPVVVYLVGSIPGSVPPATPSMTQRDTTFIPPVVVVPRGASVTFPNADPFFHNVFSYSGAQRFDLGRYPQGETKEVAFPEAGIVEVFCEVHEFMRGAILVAENPFHTVVGEDGSFIITGVPAGEHVVAFWHPDHDPVQQRVVVTAAGTARVDVVLER
jgi:plastocyanin